ncbi:peptidase M23 [Sulfurifustis variabilis]|uniref:Peptidase M23 n=1 Tax=Sulfurifustis variabilis TaxID=1675686 RepID=A0A1B4VB18_9GAMM|nr:peptidoglycan DD-metalloendopeptidase family protein [Sulfurifustis variabilis]BAU47461.1 peptidase M23 [Sulfurifustis variabilis]
MIRKRNNLSFNHELTFGTRRRRIRAPWVLSGLVVAGGLAYAVSREMPPAAPEPMPFPTAAELAVAPAPAPEPPPVRKVDIDYVVKPKDSLGSIFTALQIDVAELRAMLSDPAVQERFKVLKPGDRLTITLKNGVLDGLQRRISETEVLTVTRAESGFTAKVVETPIETQTAQVRGTINASLFVAGRAVGLSPEMLQQLATDIFGWQVDFARDIRPGDRFNVVFEQKYRNGEYLGDGRIVAAELTSNGETHRAVRYTSSDGKIDDYFTPEGQSVRRQFLRTPIDFTRVSPSSHDERQPVITTLRENQGIDYPAAIGTAVMAAADGRVKVLGERGEYGNTVIVVHGGGRSTLYAHLSGFARGLAPEQLVKQGEIIGYVGNTGAATAPHLHYEYRVNGAHAAPGTGEPEAASIPPEYLADFQAKSEALLASLEQPGEAVVTALLSD